MVEMEYVWKDRRVLAKKVRFGLRGAWDLRITVCVLADFRTVMVLFVLPQCRALLMKTTLVSDVSANGLLESKWKLG